MPFHVSHLRNAVFARRGLRGYFEYRDLAHSRDLEMIEVAAPARFKTYPAPPAARKSPARRSRA